MAYPEPLWQLEQRRLETALQPLIGAQNSERFSSLLIVGIRPQVENALALRKTADAWPDDLPLETRKKLEQLITRLQNGTSTALDDQAEALLTELERMTPSEMLEFAGNPAAWNPFREHLEYALRTKLMLTAQLGQEDASRELRAWARFNLPFEQAIAWSRDHAAELVTQVDDTTRRLLRDEIGAALQSGVSPAKLRENIRSILKESSSWRATRIAETEVMTAYRAGSLQAYRESGVVWGEEWVAGQSGMCKVCQALHGQRVRLGQPYRVTVGGKEYVIQPGRQAHPHCRCRSKPVTFAEIESKQWTSSLMPVS